MKSGPAILVIGGRVALAAVFLAAAFPKILDPEGFALAIFRYHLLPGGLVNAAALALPWIEAVAAMALLSWPRMRPAALAVMAALLAVFSSAIAFNMARGLDVACGCFTTADSGAAAGGYSLLRNGLLLLLAGGLLVYELRRETSIPR